MGMSRWLGWAVAAVAAAVPAGCSDSRALHRQAERTYERVASARMPAEKAARGDRAVGAESDGAASRGPARLALWFAPAETPAPPPAAPAPAQKKETPSLEFEPIAERSFGEVLKADLRAAPQQLWSGTKYSFANVQNLAVLSLAFGADRLVRETLDRQVRNEFRDEKGSLAATGDFGSVIGNPALHFGIACAWYGIAVENRDARNHAFSKVMIEALAINGLSTSLLKVSMNDRCPNGEYYGWPSGHMSSSMCFASVMHEYYGWQAAIPFYLLAGYSGATRLQDREHDLSDLIFGGALGWVIGHSVVKGELPQVGGFTVLPYGGNGVGGLMLVKPW